VDAESSNKTQSTVKRDILNFSIWIWGRTAVDHNGEAEADPVTKKLLKIFTSRNVHDDVKAL
jgi:hypothetical protein